MSAAQIARTHLHDVLQEANKRLFISHALRMHGKQAESWSLQCDAEVMHEYAEKVQAPLLEHNKRTPAANDSSTNDPSNTRRTTYHAR